MVELTADEREALATSLLWHFRCHAAEPEKSYASLGIENAVIVVERILAARAAQGSDLAAKVAALADEACTAIASASHSHWRVGGAGGACGACEAATERAKELRARFRALLADPAGTGDGSGT